MEFFDAIEYHSILQNELMNSFPAVNATFSEEQFLDAASRYPILMSDQTKLEELKKELLYFGAISEFLEDPSISEIIINGANNIWIERNGVLEKTNKVFLSEQSLLQIVRRQLGKVFRKIDQKNPYVDARLVNGSRICAVISPAVVGGVHICIRKFQAEWGSLEVLQKAGALSEKAKNYLKNAVIAKRNILISGATGTGKTSLLNALARIIPPSERIITLEDVAELNIEHTHVVRMEARPSNLEGEGEITIRMLLKTALRMRPDRIIVGECRQDEAIDLLQAMNTGHSGSMSTIHANSARDALSRLELLCLLGGKNVLSSNTIRAFIAASIHVVVHIEKQDGKRFIHSIQEITGLEGGVFLLKTINI